MRPLMEHVFECTDTLAGDPCVECKALVDSLQPQEETGLGLVARLFGMAIHPEAVRRVLLSATYAEPPALRRLLATTANRLVQFLLKAESGRRAVYSERAGSTREEELWRCLAAMPLYARETRKQWLRVFHSFPGMRRLMEPAIGALDPNSPLLPAFRHPIPVPPHRPARCPGRKARR